MSFAQLKREACTLEITPGVYSLAVIKSAAYAFLDKAYIVLDQVNGMTIVHLYPKKGQSLEQIKLDFHEQLLNYANFTQQQELQGDTIKKIIERALFATSPALLQRAEEEEIQQLLKDLEKDQDPEMQKVMQELRNGNPSQ